MISSSAFGASPLLHLSRNSSLHTLRSIQGYFHAAVKPSFFFLARFGKARSFQKTFVFDDRRRFAVRMSATAAPQGVEKYDATQLQFMDQEMCIVVNDRDEVIGSETKSKCHLNTEIDGRNLLHRAFSVFLFDSQGRLLLQQRAPEKITFPLVWSNTCCSHPLYTKEELEEKDFLGVKRAAVRKLEHELGIPAREVPINDLNVLSRVHYKAPTDHIWGEHEIDYIIFVQKDVSLDLNRNEVNAIRYATEPEVWDLINDPSHKVSPWFRLIVERGLLKEWWSDLKQVHTKADPSVIINFLSSK
mmetsp:Transcript_6837/g.10714  ORF Transcript_6837/g.10714 Transcript_6837/m.10714 type:complete len:302 (+) Transcript_6837:50-955(+)|eukprot:CAMPEP_0184649122 /NCGR_PEP_ID=MMETSP0308-20130426/6394_1 /TAXON_ID=38269 /ORGANISM="Gloeochaete witrockiana, Strain SAG 46.84" /LENGTH=301 /DNA_ID=CAMNT_0027081555 /DNA_START=111 /DNA_END=1016 /DNA_ORIENTATION=+